MELTLEIIALITGIIGTITGVISFFWHIMNSKPKIILAEAYFHKEKPVYDKKEGQLQHIRVKLLIKNLGHRSTTIEYISVTLGNRVEQREDNMPITVNGNSSKLIDFYIISKKKVFDDLFLGGNLYFEVLVSHTFGDLRKKGISDFKTGHFTLH